MSNQNVNFPAAEVPSGVVAHEHEGREVLVTVDGIRLILDGQGGAKVFNEGGQRLSGPGIFMVVVVDGPNC